MEEHAYKIEPKTEKMEYSSKLRVINKAYNTIGVTIPKDIVQMINLTDNDLMNFKIIPKDDDNIMIDISFIKQ